jgi:type II restriction enzyme
VLGGSYNTRSVLETLIAHTPQFYYSYPGRIENIDSSVEVKKGHKHLIWMPEKPHKQGVIEELKSDMVISEVPSTSIIYDNLSLPIEYKDSTLDVDVQRRHAQIQILLILIGRSLGFRTWVAQNDRGIMYRGKKLCELEGVVDTLKNEKLITAHEDAIKAALLIDCVWFKNGRLMPAVMEVEHSTGVTSGLTRMKGLQDTLPPFPTRYVIVAADEDREKVFKEANRPQFLTMDTRFFSYSAVEELYSLCKRRKLNKEAVSDNFLDCFMEPTISKEVQQEEKYLLVQ